MKTPYFLILKDKLDDNVENFKDALNEVWPNSMLAYSVKTNSLPWLLKYLKKKDVMAEVVSDEEYQLAELCGYSDEKIVFNGPIKGEDTLKKALESGAIVNVDSQNDLNLIEKICPENVSVGIRVNVDINVFDESDIGYTEDGFRFGFSVKNGEFKKALDIIKKSCNNLKLGLHLHCNSITRSLNVYKAISKYAAKLIKEYSLELDFIDIGGGYFGGVEGKPLPKDYITVIRDELEGQIDIEKTKLIIEPGSAIIGSVVDLHTSVIDTKNTDFARIVTTDGSRIHVDPLWAKSRYMYSIKQKVKMESAKRQIICGYTCMDHDRLMVIENEPELKVGDEIIYHRVGAYSMTFGGMFIRYFPNVYVKSKEKLTCVRTSCNVETYMNLHSV